MSHGAQSRLSRHLIGLALLALLATAAIPAGQGLASSSSTKRVVKQVENVETGGTTLTTMRGRTLYSLSVEKHGRFICTGGCTSVWHPLVVPAGVKPTGPVKLGTEKRPDGRTQVTFQGRPLYSFNGDTKKGDVNGEGIKDVGTWHAAGQEGSPPPEQTSPYPTPYPTTPQPVSPQPYPPKEENPYPNPYPYGY